MKKEFVIIMAIFLTALNSVNSNNPTFISRDIVNQTIKILEQKNKSVDKLLITKGVEQIAQLWQKNDGSEQEFINYCENNFVGDKQQRAKIFVKLQNKFENIYGYYNKLSVELKKPLHVNEGEVSDIDEFFGAWDPFSNLNEDYFKNKIAFYISLNFPFYTLEEKQLFGQQWQGFDWGYSRLGDIFTSRVPGSLLLKVGETTTFADTYISNYNIYMGNLVDNKGKTLFPKDLKLITHWGLRDELKSHYSDKKSGLAKQVMIYEVMKRIITQTIPKELINNDKYTWNPNTNKMFENNKEVIYSSEPSIRYQHILNIFHSLKAIDQYSPLYPTYISRKFDQEMEISQKDVEKMFVDFISSSEVLKVSKLIEKRIGRKLQPFDIWYDGFKTRGSISNDILDQKVKEKYPNKESFVNDLPKILLKLGFPQGKANFICSKIQVDGSRGAGHAWEAMMKSDKALLRTRIGEQGMNYKGYNIAVHEFGHNVEQTISLHDVDNYFLRGVPNTSFTEALAFIFQKRDLELLGINENNPLKKELMTLDIFWGCYEIMGVSLVDMKVWQWLYNNPKATAQELNIAVNKIAIDVWNQYYSPIFGIKDQPILAIYSHMIDAPLYLSAYPIGHLIEFQLEKYLEGKNLGEETMRIYALGRLTPQIWMKKAVGEPLSITPLLISTENAIKILNKK